LNADFLNLFFGFDSAQPITSGTHKDEGQVIRKPGSAWLEGTHAKMTGCHTQTAGNLRVILSAHDYLTNSLSVFNGCGPAPVQRFSENRTMELQPQAIPFGGTTSRCPISLFNLVLQSRIVLV